MTNVVPELWNQELLKSFTESMMAAGMVNSDNERKIVEKIANQLLPKVCEKHVYRIEHQRSMQMIDNCEYVYISWTFYNDQRVRLKARVNREDEFSYLGIRLEPMGVDFEEWQADAIMRCEAGEDVWDRPKPQPDLFAAAQAQAAAIQASQQLANSSLNQQLGQAAQSSSLQQGALSGIANALGLSGSNILRRK